MVARGLADPDLEGREAVLAAVVPIVDNDVPDIRGGRRGCASWYPDRQPLRRARLRVAEVLQVVIDALGCLIIIELTAHDGVQAW